MCYIFVAPLPLQGEVKHKKLLFTQSYLRLVTNTCSARQIRLVFGSRGVNLCMVLNYLQIAPRVAPLIKLDFGLVRRTVKLTCSSFRDSATRESTSADRRMLHRKTRQDLASTVSTGASPVQFSMVRSSEKQRLDSDDDDSNETRLATDSADSLDWSSWTKETFVHLKTCCESYVKRNHCATSDTPKIPGAEANKGCAICRECWKQTSDSM